MRKTTAESRKSWTVCPTINESDTENEIIIEPGDFKITAESVDPHYDPWESSEAKGERIQKV